jgi:2-phosphosulfolactate phosphatase
MNLDAILTPPEIAILPHKDLSATLCVVFDILRATSSIVAALANGADAVIPVGEIHDALVHYRRDPSILLAGERDGLRIPPSMSDGVAFHFGNSPREFTPEAVRHRTIVITTTNGTRALRACAAAPSTYAASLLNLEATTGRLLSARPKKILLICSGTHHDFSFEDAFAAGALCDLAASKSPSAVLTDAAHAVRQLYLHHRANPLAAMSCASNARRLLALPNLAGDVPFCLQFNKHPGVAQLMPDGRVLWSPPA